MQQKGHLPHLRKWIPIIGGFIFGQGAVQAVNMISGLLILRLLPISEFALFTISTLLINIGAITSDCGLSHALNAIGANSKGDRHSLGKLYASADKLRKRLYPIAVGVTSILAVYMMYGKEWSPIVASISLALVLISNWSQQSINLKKSLLNIHHDATGLFQVGISEALTRLFLVGLCSLYPIAITAQAVNLIGIVVARTVLTKISDRIICIGETADVTQLSRLRAFTLPLMPGVIYYMLQGHISVFLLSVFGSSNSIAQVGALSRLGQIVSLLLMLNTFLVLPYFSRIEVKSAYINRLFHVMSVIIAISGTCMLSAYFLPDWWLIILGHNYGDLERELPLAIFGQLLMLVGATLYTIVISRKSTRGQTWYIVFGIGSQIAFALYYGVTTTFDALLLNILPAVAYVVVQCILLTRAIVNWPPTDSLSDKND